MNGGKLEGKTEWTHWIYKVTQKTTACRCHFTWLNRSLSLVTSLSLALQQDMYGT